MIAAHTHRYDRRSHRRHSTTGEVRNTPMTLERERFTRVTITLPKAVVDAIDRRVGRGGRSRYISDAAVKQLRRDGIGSALRSTQGVLANADADKT